jgi:iron(III) transport system substrate-binding protein
MIRRSRPRRVLLGLPLLVAVLLAGGCTSDDDSVTLTVYSGRNEELIRPLLDRFTDETGIRVDFKGGDSADLALLIDGEGERSPADVFIAQSPGATAYLSTNDRLRPLGSEVVGLVEPQNRGEDGRWVGLSGRVRVLVYNTELVDEAELPASVLDLTEEQYRRRVAVPPKNGSFQDFVSAMRIQLGDDVTESWLEDMAANNSPVYANNTAIVAAVGRGEVPMGLVNHYYNERTKKEDPNVKSENHFFPDGDVGSLVIVTAASVVGTTDQPEEAERLIRFLLSEDSQRYFAENTQEYPLAAGAPAPEGLPPLAELDVDVVDFDQLGDEFQATIRMIEESGIDD